MLGGGQEEPWPRAPKGYKSIVTHLARDVLIYIFLNAKIK